MKEREQKHPPADLTRRAREFATNAHQQIGHRRKYTGQPYSDHLAGVARRVASVSDDPEMLAAAWLHDVVEDTTATFADVEREFGKAVCTLVEELAGASKPSDGNRSRRKRIDLQHLARASTRAMTIKLANLIDNGRDISKHDPRFAQTYLREMSALLEVLQEGDSRLYQQACRVRDQGLGQSRPAQTGEETETAGPVPAFARRVGMLHLSRMLGNAFTALEIARTLFQERIRRQQQRQLQDCLQHF